MLQEPTCSIRDCRYFLGVSQPDGTEATEVVYCEAFPNGIPNAIAYGSNKHTAKYSGQKNDLLFTKKWGKSCMLK